MYYGKYPVDHPEIILSDFKDVSAYYGLVFCTVSPPRGLKLPVLPYKCHGKLMFPLCRTCVESLNKLPCTCTEKERMLTGTWTTDEMMVALEYGYKIQAIIEVYHWEKSCQLNKSTGEKGLFTDYISTFLQYKMTASGYPKHCVTEQQKDDHVQAVYESYGFRMDKNQIKKNKGMRCLAKLKLNNLWGKFAERLDLGTTAFIYSEDAFVKAISDPTRNINNFHIINDTTVLIESTPKKAYIPASNTANVIIGLMTTAQARIRLYRYMALIGGDRCLYTDTDSIIYTQKPGESEIQTGSLLGEMDDELGHPDIYIQEFCSAGSKNYAYRTNLTLHEDGTLGEGSTICKVKGFTLNVANQKLINIESMKELVHDYAINGKSGAIQTHNPFKIVRAKKSCEIFTVQQSKKYRVVFEKRVLHKDFTTSPYGF